MNTIKNKLRSKNGASLMLALLFLLFCVLIGGTILAAASANGFRTTRVANKQQELKDGSAAQLIADQLDGGFSLTIDIAASPITATLEGDYTPMGRLVAEMAVCRYLKETGGSEANLVCNGTTIPKASFWYQHDSSDNFVGTVKLSGTDAGDKEVEVSMSSYNISVNLGEDSHVIVQMKGNKKEVEGENPVISWSKPQIKKEG